MDDRPKLSCDMDCDTFCQYYYLKEELVCFCRENNLQATGSKEELQERIAVFLRTGQSITSLKSNTKPIVPQEITLDTIIESSFICSEKHRSFFKEHIGKSFSFIVPFQKWLKANAGKTYRESIEAYFIIMEQKQISKLPIDTQFEYNTYIRDFFADNKGRTLQDAIKCWKYKKGIKGHNRYEKSDLIALS